MGRVIRSKHNNLLNYFLYNDSELSPAYVAKCKKFFKEIEKNNFVVTFKTEKEVSDYIGMHISEERRLLWLGFFIANNYIAQKLEDDGIELVKKK